ncbi:Hypothetical_protein [Hexamita inflata]|uniref:Hypothetical_protein n=1 Tax=Hexamita inflata TaxID=28002 RepID=A0AA86UH57_9EUKA|nr:Hypothetical protein HINF_LOCUS39331 [Hexamita inflata]
MHKSQKQKLQGKKLQNPILVRPISAQLCKGPIPQNKEKPFPEFPRISNAVSKTVSTDVSSHFLSSSGSDIEELIKPSIQLPNSPEKNKPLTSLVYSSTFNSFFDKDQLCDLSNAFSKHIKTDLYQTSYKLKENQQETVSIVNQINIHQQKMKELKKHKNIEITRQWDQFVKSQQPPPPKVSNSSWNITALGGSNLSRTNNSPRAPEPTSTLSKSTLINLSTTQLAQKSIQPSLKFDYKKIQEKNQQKLDINLLQKRTPNDKKLFAQSMNVAFPVQTFQPVFKSSLSEKEEMHQYMEREKQVSQFINQHSFLVTKWEYDQNNGERTHNIEK